MKIDQDIVQRIKVMGIFALQFYKVLTGTMLSLFIPQACYGEDNSLQVCSLTQNYEKTEIYHQFTMYWNGFSFFCFIFCYLLELRREHWAIKFLDVDNDKPDNSLKAIIVNEPNLDKRYLKLDNCFVLPHIGSATHETRLAMSMMAVDNIYCFFNKKPLISEVV